MSANVPTVPSDRNRHTMSNHDPVGVVASFGSPRVRSIAPASGKPPITRAGSMQPMILMEGFSVST